MDKFYIISNTAKQEAGQVAAEIAEYLQEKGCCCLLQKETFCKEPPDYHYTNASGIPLDTQCIIVLGGDGTLLQAARDTLKLQIPLFGINLGTLGYLAEVDRASIYPALEHLIRDEYEIEHRMMLTGSVYHEGKLIREDVALNDIVITRTGPLRVVRFQNYVNNTFLNSYSADGVIISTPTGSTGYSLSAGGPLISPAAAMIMLTPLAAHTLNSRSVIFSAEDTITVQLAEGRDGGTEHGVATFDGDTSVEMVTGDKIIIGKAKKDTQIVKISDIGFLEILRKKMANN